MTHKIKIIGIITFVAIFAFLTVATASAQTTESRQSGSSSSPWFMSYAPGIDSNMIFVNAGIGLGPTGGYSRGIPPLSASVDVKLPIDLPITAGASVIYSTWKWRYVDVTYTNIGVNGRGMYHIGLLEDLDLYAGLALGWVVQTTSHSSYKSDPFFLWGLTSGARYFFTNFLGAYLELGWNGLQYVSTGVTLKF